MQTWLVSNGLVAPAGQRFAEPLLAVSLLEFPGGVEIVDAGIERLMNDADRFFLRGAWPRWKPPRPMIETLRPVFPSARRAIVPPAEPPDCAGASAAIPRAAEGDTGAERYRLVEELSPFEICHERIQG